MGNSEEKDSKNMRPVYCVSLRKPAGKITIIQATTEKQTHNLPLRTRNMFHSTNRKDGVC